MFIIIGCAVLILLLVIGFILAYNRLQQLSVKVEEAASGIDVALEKRWDLLNELLAAVKKYLSHEYETLTGITALRSSTGLESQRLNQQAEISAETMRSIDQEINLQSQNMQKIRSQLNEENCKSSSFQSRFRAHSQNQSSQSLLHQTSRRRKKAVGQKIETLASLHRDLNGVTAGINALYEQYPLLNSWISLDQYQRATFQTEEHLQAARRLYNSNVSLYNQTLRTIPWSLIASLCRMKPAGFYETNEKKRNFEANFG